MTGSRADRWKGRHAGRPRKIPPIHREIVGTHTVVQGNVEGGRGRWMETSKYRIIDGESKIVDGVAVSY